MTKTQSRSAAKGKRAAFVTSLTVAQRYAAAVVLADIVIQHLGDARTVSAYLPIGSEMDTLPLIGRLEERGMTIALPHVTSRRSPLRFLKWAPGDALEAGPLGLRQPDPAVPDVIPELILTPLLAFDGALNRLGYGAGHYDRAFAALPDARRVGIAWSVQQVDQLPVDPWDIPLHAVATEREWICR